jgi:hypothetical protein
MDAIDWKAPARLRGRNDAGSDEVARDGTVRELVHQVSLLSAEHREGIVLEVEGGRTLDLQDILELAARGDLGE